MTNYNRKMKNMNNLLKTLNINVSSGNKDFDDLLDQ